jgi:hypothetical protein
MYIRNDSEFNNSRVINYNRWSNAKEVDALVNELSSNITSRKKLGYSNAIKVLLLDLYQSYITDKDQYIGYYRDASHYNFKVKQGAKDRYVVNPYVTYDYLKGSVDMFLKLGLLSGKTGSHYYNKEIGEYGFLSRMRATDKLALLWQKHGFNPDMIHKYKQEEVILLKDNPIFKIVKSRKTGKDKKMKVKKPFGYSDTDETNRMRSIVLAYNRQLDNTHIDCDAECISDADRKELIDILTAYKKDPVISIDLAKKNVFRVFNNQSFEQGGRFYGAWWIGCPSILRKYITINGESTVELDYSGIHIQLLYAMKGINYAAKKEDAYTLDDGLPDRDLNKLILLTSLNAEDEIKARDSVYVQLRKDNKLEFYKFNRKKLPITKKIALLKAKHPDITEFIAEGEGIKLQYLDSCIIEKLISYGIRLNIPILTIHDSVICQTKYSDLIKDKMWQYYSDMLNTKLKCNIRYTGYTLHARNAIRILTTSNNQTRPPYNYTLKDALYKRYKTSPEMITETLRSDDIIKIKADNRSNTCNGTCKHSVRVLNYNSNKRNYLGSVKVKLVVNGSTCALRIKG